MLLYDGMLLRELLREHFTLLNSQALLCNHAVRYPLSRHLHGSQARSGAESEREDSCFS
jgi:hypothetical protein